MEIQIYRKVTEVLRLDKITILKGGMRDVDSIKLTVTYDQIEIGYGHLNIVTNFAHVTIEDGFLSTRDTYLLEYLLQEKIEGRTITIE